VCTHDVDIQCAVAVPDGLLAQLEAAVHTALVHALVEASATLAVLLTDDAHIRELNRNYLDVDEPTDVLSFPSGDTMPGMGGEGAAGEDAASEDIARHLGDIAISIPFAERQAAAAGHTLADELQLLAVHGTLHLLGHDHAEPEEKRRMWRTQSQILTKLGLQEVDPARDSDA
jgi:probable rRNA maturation factor